MFYRSIEENLKKWQKQANRKPLVIRGARQTGKTSVVRKFAQENFQDLIYINLEKDSHFQIFSKVNSVEDFQRTIAAFFNKEVNKQTLIFIDEIQNIPQLITLLRFFYEEKPDLPVVAAGSLLEAKIKEEGISMPVGRVEYLYVYPLTFFEFLRAKNREKLLEHLQELSFDNPPSEAIHKQALDEFYEYVRLGGMPEVIKNYLENPQGDFSKIYDSLLTSYIDDLRKYANESEIKYLKHVLSNAPTHAGGTISFEKFADSEYRSREMSEAFESLQSVMLLRLVESTSSKQLPLTGKLKRPRKLLFLDVGLVNFQSDLQKELINNRSLNDFYRGRIAEQVVGQSLLASSLHSKALFYWSLPKEKSPAEVDFCFNFGGKIVGLEVKSGPTARFRSLMSFAQKTENHLLLRVYNGPLVKESISVGENKEHMYSLPFYLIDRAYDFCEEVS